MTVFRRVGTEAVTPPATTSRRTHSVVSYQLAGRFYPYAPRSSHCKVCNSDQLIYIERNLIKSYGYTMIWNSLPEEAKAELSVRNISDHAKAHLPDNDLIMAHAAVRQRSEELGQDIEASTQAMVDQISFAKVGLQQVFAGLMSGEIKPDMKDGIALAQFLSKTEEAAGGDTDNAILKQAMLQYVLAMSAVCTPDQIAAIQAKLNANPVMQAMLASRAPVYEGEIIPEAEAG